jgi:hypothetical protein
MGTYDEVEVFIPYNGVWSAGFEVADTQTGPTGEPEFRLRRQSDGSVLPTLLPADRIRPAHSAPRSR